MNEPNNSPTVPDLEPVFPSCGEIPHMSRTARLRMVPGTLALGGLLLPASSSWRRAATAVATALRSRPPRPRPGRDGQAQTFFRKALELDPNNAEARQGFARTVRFPRGSAASPFRTRAHRRPIRPSPAAAPMPGPARQRSDRPAPAAAHARSTARPRRPARPSPRRARR